MTILGKCSGTGGYPSWILLEMCIESSHMALPEGLIPLGANESLQGAPEPSLLLCLLHQSNTANPWATSRTPPPPLSILLVGEQKHRSRGVMTDFCSVHHKRWPTSPLPLPPFAHRSSRTTGEEPLAHFARRLRAPDWPLFRPINKRSLAPLPPTPLAWPTLKVPRAGGGSLAAPPTSLSLPCYWPRWWSIQQAGSLSIAQNGLGHWAENGYLCGWRWRCSLSSDWQV